MDMKIKLKTKGLIILGIFVLSFIGIISITVVTVQDKIISTALEKLRSDKSLGQALYNELIAEHSGFGGEHPANMLFGMESCSRATFC